MSRQAFKEHVAEYTRYPNHPDGRCCFAIGVPGKCCWNAIEVFCDDGGHPGRAIYWCLAHAPNCRTHRHMPFVQQEARDGG